MQDPHNLYVTDPETVYRGAYAAPVGNVVYGPSAVPYAIPSWCASYPHDFWDRVAREVAKLIVEKTKV